jgi:hypothetical protein
MPSRGACVAVPPYNLWLDSLSDAEDLKKSTNTNKKDVNLPRYQKEAERPIISFVCCKASRAGTIFS